MDKDRFAQACFWLSMCCAGAMWLYLAFYLAYGFFHWWSFAAWPAEWTLGTLLKDCPRSDWMILDFLLRKACGASVIHWLVFAAVAFVLLYVGFADYSEEE